MTKYLEELKPGNTFENNNNKYILTIDYKKDGSKLCINLIDGSSRWMKSNSMVTELPIYSLDTNNNFSPIIQYNNAPSINQNTNIS